MFLGRRRRRLLGRCWGAGLISFIGLGIVALVAIVMLERKLKAPKAPVAWFLLVTTVLYLVVELSFNARLLDVVGRRGVAEDIAGVEHWGKLISGFAVALAFWGVLAQFAARQDWPTARLVSFFIGSAIAIVPLVYVLEEASVESGVDRASAEERQMAALSVTVTGYVRWHRNISGLPLTSEILTSPEGKAFYALMPSMYHAVLAQGSRTLSISEPAVRHEVEQAIGSAERTYGDVYGRAVNEMETLYATQYRPGADAYNSAVASAPWEANRAWVQYVDRLWRERRWTPDSVPPYAQDRVRRIVRDEMSVPVPENWPLWDQYTFEQAVQRRILNAAEAEWRARSAEAVEGAVLPTNIASSSQFFAWPQVQQRLRREPILSHCTGDVIPDRMARAAWERRCHTPFLRAASDEYFSALTGGSSAFESGGRHHCVGVMALHAQHVPSFALSLSLIGAFYHASKVVWYLCYLIPFLGAWYARWPIRLCFIAYLIALPFIAEQPHRIVGSPAYNGLIAYKASQDGRFDALLFDWIVRAETLYFPASDRLRRHVLGNFPFPPPSPPEPECTDVELTPTRAPDVFVPTPSLYESKEATDPAAPLEQSGDLVTTTPTTDSELVTTTPQDVRPSTPSPQRRSPSRNAIITNPRWLERPNGADFARYYPDRAARADRQGRVVLDCLVRADGRVSCSVASEDPAGWGFGEASLQAARRFRMSPRLEDGRPSEGGRVRIPMVWRLAD